MPLFVVTNTPSANVRSFTVHIDDRNVTAGGDFDLPIGSHKLHWWFAGPTAETLGITIAPKQGGTTLVSVSDSIMPGYPVEAGDKGFVVQ